MRKQKLARIWAPWRSIYIKKMISKKGACLFCRSLKLKRKNYIFFKNKYSFAMLNIFPYNNGHAMVAPFRHIRSLNNLNDKEIEDIFKTLRRVMSLLDKILKPQGYNVGINIGKCSGAGIPNHLHLHIVPRWEADTNFMPILGNAKVISQSLDELFLQLRKEVRTMNKNKK